MILSNKVKKILPYLIGAITFIYILKPKMFFKQNNQLRSYGFGVDADGYKKTVYTMQNIVIFLTIILYTFIK